MRSFFVGLAMVAIGLIFTGCKPAAPAGSAETGPAAAAPGPPGPPGPPTVAADETAAAPEIESVKAEVGVGSKGRDLDEHEGLYVTPAKQYFAFKEKVVFDIQIPEALKLYAALEGDGQGPKSHAEFMEKIIQANQIKLPQLKEGHTYRFDPETQQLMVDRPKK